MLGMRSLTYRRLASRGFQLLTTFTTFRPLRSRLPIFANRRIISSSSRKASPQVANMTGNPYQPLVLDFGRVWWREIIIYEIYVQSFQDSNNDGIGDLRGIINRLDYLKKLGVDMLWLTPIYESPLDDQGYDISNYKKIHPQYGTMEDWEELCEKVHEKGMKLMMDMVFNHSSSEVGLKDSPTRNRSCNQDDTT